MINKIDQKVVSLTKKYFKTQFSDISDDFNSAFSNLDISKLNDSDKLLFEKMNAVFFLGQLVGLPTLQSILTKFGVTSTGLQINFKKLYKKITTDKLRLIFEFVFEKQVAFKLKEMASKDSSIWSKKQVTAILDDSIFRQWLSEVGSQSKFYGAFRSGQYHSTVFGFKVVCFGLYIDDIFYLLYFDFVEKEEKKEKEETEKKKTKKNKSIEVAKKLITRWTRFKSKLEKENIPLPVINFSCDNGYSNVSLSEECNKEITALNYISVPRKNQKISINNKKENLSEYIENEFLVQEKQHQENEKHLKEEEKTPFNLRVKAFYQCQKREVVFLFFRLNGSKNVSVIYTTNLTIFAKTLRRHWFNRTYIEQFFKTLKHVLKISEPRTKTKEEFENKLLQFVFLAVEVQKIVRFIRKKCKQFKQKGFISLQRILCSNQEILDLLQNQINVKT